MVKMIALCAENPTNHEGRSGGLLRGDGADQ